MHDFASLSEVEEALEGLAARDEPLVARLERQPGQKEARYAQLLAGPVDDAAPAEDRPDRAERAESWVTASPSRPDRVAALEQRVESLEAELAILRAEHQELREELGLGGASPAPATLEE